ncbi:hypothetical protein NT01EI_0393 [Edwardsiella ictaluri 93-146]|uniref:Uncharacterized protein n=1 Tax=Edwardsiella ictaluri (strain 93-146) TaxID=634503 RepID=C5BDL8_EDWI9|nr:hypothetical protein NT01EI_0393 [Edwardsiella ictaluri 93-146]
MNLKTIYTILKSKQNILKIEYNGRNILKITFYYFFPL